MVIALWFYFLVSFCRLCNRDEGDNERIGGSEEG